MKHEHKSVGTYMLAVRTLCGWQHFQVPREIYTYVRQMEVKLNTPGVSRLFDLYPQRFARGIKAERAAGRPPV
jgi:hypothetical protein